MFTNPEINATTKTEILKLFMEHMPESYVEYLRVKDLMATASFTNAPKLAAKESGEDLPNFLSFITELNLAYLLTNKSVTDLGYEVDPGLDIDFSFDDIDLSAKNIGMKNYERTEYLEIERLKSEGGGTSVFSHKNFSEIFIEVQKNDTGSYSYTRTESGNSGSLDSDTGQMSTVLETIGKCESKIKNEGRKKVLLFLSHTSNFRPYHAYDIAVWYFNARPKNYAPIFGAAPALYLKYFKKENKENNIDALVFIFPPGPIIWPESSLMEVVQGMGRLGIYTKDEPLWKNLKNIFS
jgi:hypothetical protein